MQLFMEFMLSFLQKKDIQDQVIFRYVKIYLNKLQKQTNMKLNMTKKFSTMLFNLQLVKSHQFALSLEELLLKKL